MHVHVCKPCIHNYNNRYTLYAGAFMRVHLHMLYTGVHVYKHIEMAQIISYIYAFMVLGAQLHCVPLLITTPTSITAAVRAAITITPATTMPAIAPALNA